MFDKLIVSEPDRTAIKHRRNYFMVSSVVVGILFITAVVISIYAEDFGIGNGGIELTEMLAPVDMAAAAPEPLKTQPQTSRAQNQTITREVNMERVDESYSSPSEVSTVPNTQQARPYDRFIVTGTNSGPSTLNGTGRDTSGGGGSGQTTGGITSSDTVAETETEKTPPPTIKKDPPSNVVRSIGVANGKATSLPKPQFPPAAIALNLQGKVDVQVMIDETGKVVSVKAASGHPFFRVAAEKAAWGARFTPTLLSNVPVKVTGVIVYNFTRN